MYGPQLPPGWNSADKNSNDTKEEEEAPESYGSAPPPHIRSPHKTNKDNQPKPKSRDVDATDSGLSRRRRVAGPTMPPPSWTAPNTHTNDDDDVVGPKPLDIPDNIREETDRLERLREIEERIQGAVDTTHDASGSTRKSSSSGKVQREDWMTVPPESLRLDAMGPQMRPRQFSARGVGSKASTDSSKWTETPEEREKRVAGDSSGRDRKRQKKHDEDVPVVRSREEEETAEAVARHNAMHRPSSLVESFSKDYLLSGRFEDEDVTKRGFDRDRDLVSRRVDSKSRKRLLDDAKNLGTRFSSGKKSFL